MSEVQADLKDLRVLLADDHAFIRNLTRGMLLRAGIANVHAASSATEAVAILRQRGSSIDVVISDWNMPPQGGMELLRQIRTASIVDIPASLPFIMLTGHAASDVVTAALQLDVSAYIVKPASSAKLTDAIRKAINKSITVKSARHYEAVQGIELPAPTDATSEDPATWAKWVKGGKEAILNGNTQFIKRDAIQLTAQAAPPADADEIKNIRYRRADRIKPGAVLVEDFCDAEGVALVNAGTVLNQEIIARLNAMQDDKGEKVRLWVGQRELTRTR